MNGLKRMLHSRRGFTLVELVVVLVILGVVGSISVPALTGYIDNGKEKQAVSEAQACVIEATRQGAQNYALVQNASVAGKAENATALTRWAGELKTAAPEVKGGTVALTEGSGTYLLHVEDPPAGSIATTTIAADAGVKGTVQGMTCNASGQVLYLVYTSADGIQVIYTATGSTASVDTDDKEISVPTPQPTAEPTPEPEPEPEEPTLTVTVYKKAADDKITDVIGAHLVISGDSGTFSFDSVEGGNSVKLKAGNYTLTETSAPDDYEIAAAVKFKVVNTNGYMHVDRDGDSEGNSDISATGNSITMYDKKKTVDPVPDFDTVNVTIHLEDGVTKAPMAGLKFKMYPINHEEESFTVTTDSNGNIVLPIHHSTANPNTDFVKYALQEYWSYTLVEESAPAGYQALLKVAFGFQLKYDPYDPHKISISNSGSPNKFNGEYLTGGESSPVLHIQRFPVPVLHIRKVNTDGIRLSGGNFDITLTDVNGSRQYSFDTDSTKDYDFSIEVKMHDGDGITSNNYLDMQNGKYYSSVSIKEASAPSGYQKASSDFGCSLSPTRLYNESWECTPDVSINPWNQNGNTNYRIESDSRPLHHVITIIDEPEATTPTVSTCKVNISKMVYETKTDKDGKKTDTDASTTQVLMPSSLKAVLRLTGPGVYEEWATDGKAKTFNLLPGTYRLQEISAPNGYLTAMPISFTVKDTDTSLDISMLDLTTDDETDKPVFPVDNVTVTLEPKSWAHKLTHDGVDKDGNGELKFNNELLIWNGDLYYNYKYDKAATENLKNERQEEFANFFNAYGVMPGDTPDPIAFLDKLGKKGTDYLIKLSGNFYLWDSTQPPVTSLSKGDVLIVPVSGKDKYKAYIYKADTSLVITNADSSGKPYANGKAYMDALTEKKKDNVYFTDNIGSSYIKFN